MLDDDSRPVDGPQVKDEELLAAPILAAEEASAAVRLFHLYEGNDLSHGQCDVTGYKDNGKAIADVKTHKTPATPQLWERHLLGRYGLGVVPLLPDRTCTWGACDLDDYETDIAVIATRVAALGIPAL